MTRQRLRVRLVALILALAPAAARAGSEVDGEEPWILSCDSIFGPEVGAAALAQRFGAASVRDTLIYLGEGFSERGSVLFPDSADLRVEILWADTLARRMPRSVRIRGEASRWRTARGLTLGLDLQTAEVINEKPFRLMGFAWDYEGTTMSWGGGTLESPDSTACVIRARFRPDVSAASTQSETWKWYRQVQGDQEFSSGHRAMQALNPRVFEVWLDCGR
ncbi:MAG: hypothetical protein MUE60_10620 [Candidatus Eisenbacteria bacterium]|jgi:hypothetical protein|nr:hypothetical protein [Candidatus Eisenbacteria bacterium]